MTEYEIASLALEQAAGIRDQSELLQGQAELITVSVATFFTILFGYLIVAYLVARDLTRLQVFILNFIYLLIMLVIFFASANAHTVGIFRYAELLELQPETVPVPFWTIEFQVFTLCVLAVAVAASLWFMWSVRHPRST